MRQLRLVLLGMLAISSIVSAQSYTYFGHPCRDRTGWLRFMQASHSGRWVTLFNRPPSSDLTRLYLRFFGGGRLPRSLLLSDIRFSPSCYLHIVPAISVSSATDRYLFEWSRNLAPLYVQGMGVDLHPRFWNVWTSNAIAIR